MCSENQNLDKLNLHLPLSSLFEDFDGILAYEDMLHLTKFDRYRLICGSYICPSLSKDESTFNVDSFRDVGVKDYVLDPLRAKKMDDNLPLQFFSQENIQKAIQAERYDLLLALLTSYLLINSLMSTELTRQQRIEQLTFGFSIVAIYYNDYQKYDFSKGLQRKFRCSGKNNYMTLYEPIRMKKYMSLTISFTKALGDPKAIHLRALGTHLLEHFLGWCEDSVTTMTLHHPFKVLLKILLSSISCKLKTFQELTYILDVLTVAQGYQIF